MSTFLLYGNHFLSHTSTAQCGEKSPLLMTSLLRGKKVWRVPQFPQAFGTLPEGPVSVLAQPRSLCNWHSLDAGGQRRMNEREAC